MASCKSVKVPLVNAQAALEALRDAGLLRKGFKPEAKGSWFFLPLPPGSKVPKLPFAFEQVKHDFIPLQAPSARPLKELLKGELSPSQQKLIHSSYDLVGDIAVLSIPTELEPKKMAIANALLRSNPRIKVVAQKEVTKGNFRVRHVKVLAGPKRTRTTHRENGCTFTLDLNKAYFSTRLSNERKRITELVRPKEKVLVVFAGVGPFAIEIARKMALDKKKCSVTAIEWSPFAAKLMEENARANKVGGLVQILQGDASKALASRKLSKWADRIVMPLLLESIDFVPLALKAAAKGAVVHVYGIVPAVQGEKDAALKEKAKAVLEIFRKAGRKCRLNGARFCGSYSPRVAQAVFDVLVLD